MIFIPQGFKMGMVASLTGVLLLIILVIAEKIQKKVKGAVTNQENKKKR